MFVVFGDGKCPICGRVGDKTNEEKIFSCPDCEIHFNKYGVCGIIDLKRVERNEIECH